MEKFKEFTDGTNKNLGSFQDMIIQLEYNVKGLIDT